MCVHQTRNGRVPLDSHFNQLSTLSTSLLLTSTVMHKRSLATTVDWRLTLLLQRAVATDNRSHWHRCLDKQAKACGPHNDQPTNHLSWHSWFLIVWWRTVKIITWTVNNQITNNQKCYLIACGSTVNDHWDVKNRSCNLSGICSFYNIVILAPIATIFIILIDSSVLHGAKGSKRQMYYFFGFLHGSLQLFGTVPLFHKGRIWEMLNRLPLSANVRQIEEQLATLTVGCITS